MIFKFLKYSSMALLAILAVIYFYLCYTYSTNFPFNHDDGVNFLRDFGIYVDGRISIVEYLIKPKNGCPHAIDRIINYISYVLLGNVNYKFIILLGNMSVIFVLVTLATILKLDTYELLICALIILVPISYTMIFPTCVGTYYYVFLLYMIGINLMHKLVFENRRIYMIPIIALSVLLLFTFCNGFLGTFLLVCILLFYSIIKKQLKITILVLATIIISLIIFYYINYVSSTVNPHTRKASTVKKIISLFEDGTIVDCINYVFSYVGVLFKYVIADGKLARTVAFYFGISSFLFSTIVFLKKLNDFKISLAYFIMIFVLLTAFLSYIARMKMNFWAPRYENFAMFYCLGFMLVLLKTLKSYIYNYQLRIVILVLITFVSYNKFQINLGKLKKMHKQSIERLELYKNSGVFKVQKGTGGTGEMKIKMIEKALEKSVENNFYIIPD